MKNVFVLFLCITIFASCNSTENKAIGEAMNIMTASKSTFTCKINGKDFTSTSTDPGMVYDVMGKKIVVGGDDGKFNISVAIPYESPKEKEINTFDGIYGDHTTKISKVDQDFITNKKLVITKRSKGFIAGTFSFTVGSGADNLKPFEITDGKFETTLLLDE
jgi:chemotaxis protein CheY-P-specific phosphatase CheC